MSSYIRSNCNRFYAAVEPAYGVPAQVTSSHRFPATRLRAQQAAEDIRRLDKTGTRTMTTAGRDGRCRTAFEVRTYLSSWTGTVQVPYGSLFQAAMGAGAEAGKSVLVDSAASPLAFTTTTPHERTVGSAISDGQDIRFVTSVVDPYQVNINAPFSRSLASGTQLTATVTYRLAADLPSISIYDYWDPITAISRIVTGAAVDTMQLSVNGDQHEFAFTGPAADLIDSATFSSGTTGLSAFPTEPPIEMARPGAVPGHLGQAWLGGTSSQFFTVTEATIQLQNSIELRSQEFGSSYPRAAVPGLRQVNATFSLFAQDDSQTIALYTAAKNCSAISMMLQMGKQKGQLMGAYLPSLVPLMPAFDDSESRLKWRFKNNLAQGTSDDELYIAFA